MTNQHTYERNELARWRECDRVRIVTLPNGRYAMVKDGRIVEVLA